MYAEVMACHIIDVFRGTVQSGSTNSFSHQLLIFACYVVLVNGQRFDKRSLYEHLRRNMSPISYHGCAAVVDRQREAQRRPARTGQ